jgi:predicted dehydrogenase
MADSTRGDSLRLAVIGTGTQGLELIRCGLAIPGVQVAAVCDIWPHARRQAAALLSQHGQAAAEYEDYRAMLNKEKGLDAAIVATPDSFHADQAVACLEAGLNVYCEAPMHHTLAGARQMVLASRRTGRRLQVGQQRRSNPRYRAALDLIDEKKGIGRIGQASCHWHGHKRVRQTCDPAHAIPEQTLRKYGYASMEEHRNWRWLSKFSAGELALLGSHQLDVLNWFLHATPSAIRMVGGLDYYDFFDLYDNAVCLLEWQYARKGPARTVRGACRIQTSFQLGGHIESFVGKEGAVAISEDPNVGGIMQEAETPFATWEKGLPVVYVAVGDSIRSLDDAKKPEVQVVTNQRLLRVHPPIPYPEETRPAAWYHLKNFLDSVRVGGTLTCPADVGYQAAATVFGALEAMKTGRRIEFKPEDFAVAGA